MKLFLSIPFFLLFFSGIAQAQDITISPCDQNGINAALQSVYNSGGGSVYLNSGAYEVTGQIRIGSNTRLTGSPDAIIRISSASNQWFVDGVGIVGTISEPVNNIEIDGFQVDENLKAFPQSYANSGSGNHNAERLIDLRASEGARANNIKIHDLKLYDAFSDALHIAFANNVNVYNVFCSDCQHSSIYYVDVLGGEINNNEVAGICSDDIRLDNCQYIKVHDNLLYSFIGNSGGKYQTGENGLQAGDQGFSHGGGSPKPDHTANLDIYNNTFAGKMLRAVWLDADGLTKGNNVYVHDNRYVEIEGINTSGISFTNPPTVQQSEDIFTSILDILNKTLTDSAVTNQTADSIQYKVQKTDNGLVAGGIKIIGFANEVNIDNTTYIPDSNSAIVKYEVVQSPRLDLGIGLENISKEVITKVENGNITVILNIVTKYYTIAYNSITKKSTRSTIKVSKLSFSDTVIAPKILNRPANLTGIASEYQSNITHYTLISVPYEGLQKLVFEYNGSKATYYCMIGEKHTNENGIEYTNYTRSDFWIDGNLSHFGASLYIPGNFESNKLKVTAYTPYESFPVKIIKENRYWNRKSFSDTILAFLAQLFVFIVIGWILLRIPFKL